MKQISWWLADTTLKLKMLWLYRGELRQWYADVWKQDAGQRMCCDGRMCGCQGSDYFEYWTWLWNDSKEQPTQ